jgi:replicative DNA helicase
LIIEKFKNKKFEFGKNLEFEVAKTIIDNRRFLVSVIEYVDSDFFDSKTAGIVVDIAKNHFKKYSDSPTIDIIKAEAKNYLTPKDDVDLFFSELKQIEDLVIPETEKQYVRDQTIALCQYNALKLALFEGAEILITETDLPEDYVGTINEKIKKAISVAEHKDLGLNYLNNPQVRIAEEIRNRNSENRISTGIKRLNDVLYGGWSSQESTLSVVVAPTGIGKSIFLCNFGAAAVNSGKKVIHFTHELSEMKTAARYDSILSKVKQSDRLEVPSEREKLFRSLAKIQNQYGDIIRIKEYPTKTCSTMTIRSYIEKVRELENFVPDIIITDYLDIMVANFNAFTEDEYNQQKRISVELRALAQELDVPIITASQTNRTGAKGDDADEKASKRRMLRGTDIAESFGKVFASDLLMSVNQTPEERSVGKCSLYIDKNRNGPCGLRIPMVINYDTMSILEACESDTDADTAYKAYVDAKKNKDKPASAELEDDDFIPVPPTDTVKPIDI